MPSSPHVCESPSGPGGPRRLPAALALATAAAILTGTVVVAGLGQLPEGPGYEALQTICSKCHAPERAASLRLTAEGWDTVLGDMVTRGAIGTPAEWEAVREYLITNFLGEEPPPLNINTATNLDLEAVAGLTRSEAATLRRWLDTSGPCLILEDLKQVEGVPYEKIEERRAYLMCFVPKLAAPAAPAPTPAASTETSPSSEDQ